jgi:hypothetical protein
VPWDLACEKNGLSAEQLVLSAGQESAEGVIRSAERLKARTLPRSYGGVGGGGREAFSYPEWATEQEVECTS